jgi:hypothetical protein
MYILSMVFYFAKSSLDTLIVTWSVLILAALAVGLLADRRELLTRLRSCEPRRFLAKIDPVLLIAVVLILVQAFMLFGLTFEDADDAYFVATATTAVETNTIVQYDPYTGDPLQSINTHYVLSPHPMVYAVLGRLTLLHSTIVAHTILPLFLIPLSYIIYALFAREVLGLERRRLSLFLILLSLLNLFGAVSRFTNSIYLLGRIWQGKSVLANIALPATFYFAALALAPGRQGRAMALLLLAVLTGCFFSSTSVGFIGVPLAVLAVIAAWRQKSPTPLVKAGVAAIPLVLSGAAYILIR